MGGVGGLLWAAAAVLVRRSGGEGLPLLPGLVPARMPRMACDAPKLILRAKGVPGVGAPRSRMSSSSTAFSSIESELVDRLARRRKAADAVVVGEVPDSPSVVMERRRRWSFMAADESGPGKADTGAWLTELARKRLDTAEVTDPRRWLLRAAMSVGAEGVLLLLELLEVSDDMVKEGGGVLQGEGAGSRTGRSESAYGT